MTKFRRPDGLGDLRWARSIFMGTAILGGFSPGTSRVFIAADPDNVYLTGSLKREFLPTLDAVGERSSSRHHRSRLTSGTIRGMR